MENTLPGTSSQLDSLKAAYASSTTCIMPNFANADGETRTSKAGTLMPVFGISQPSWMCVDNVDHQR